MTKAKMSQIDHDLAQLTMSGELEVARPAIEVLVAGLEDQVRSKMFRVLNGAEGLTPHDALCAWVELHAYSRLRTRLTQALNMGQSAGKALENAWEPQTDGE